MFFKKIDKKIIDRLAIESLNESLYAFIPGLPHGLSEDSEPYKNCIEFLQGSFADFFHLGGEYSCVESGLCFDNLRLKGKSLVGKMLEVTNGLHTHVGAVFSLSLMACACGRLDALGIQLLPEYLIATIADYTKYYSYKSFINLSLKTSELTYGEKLYLESGDLSIRGNAEEGFRSILDMALPFIAENSSDFIFTAKTENDIHVTQNHTILSLKLMSILNDSGVIINSGSLIMEEVKKTAKELAENYSLDKATEFDLYLRENRIEPKATMGMLALCLFTAKLLNLNENTSKQ